MKILKVSIIKLFGIFDHEIALNQEHDITIVLGENGIGKTKILEALNAVFSKDFDFLKILDFKVLSIFFDNDECWEFTKSAAVDGSELYVQKKSPRSKSSKPQLLAKNLAKPFPRSPNDPREVRRRRKMAEVDAARIRNELVHSHAIDGRDMLVSERQLLALSYFTEREIVEPVHWLAESIEEIKVRLIETQRIITRNDLDKNYYESAVMQCSNDLKELISFAIKSSADITSTLDSTYPNRLVQNLRERTEYTYSELNEELADLNDKRKFLSAAGLLAEAHSSDLFDIEDKNNDLIIISMKQYVEDSKKKLQPYEELATKISLFMDIVSSRFKHKKIRITKDDGIAFSSIIPDKSGAPQFIELEKLSSGEQHELVLFYKLIFDSRQGDLILIDEPELSLHISWQTQFIPDLKRVAALGKFSAVIATHSPDIISSNWDLRVELLGVE
ncbi:MULTISPECIES: AAA family ATPase [Pseudomonas]|uniref:AAA family ATPase n=1 Tax=Pseudomonas TaxID=286 RepID=UPI00209E474D|nr:AAA family ATPase [Pseudomonas rhodesiae]MCP1512879.1 putative ATP-binding protein involved in virulence [Pseudomonas rhodesiae]MDF9771737.1 putative ATP-binding protein involved in virulence [Pseudomonas rhodesiae]